jgi:hypothetical protein
LEIVEGERNVPHAKGIASARREKQRGVDASDGSVERARGELEKKVR